VSQKTFLLTAALLASATTAEAGWHARSIENAIADGQKQPAQTSDIYFQNGKMRIDQGTRSSVIYDLGVGRMTMMSHAEKAYVTQTLAQMKKMREQMEAAAKTQMAGLPADVRAELEAKMEKMEAAKADANKPKPTGETTKVKGRLCSVYKWKAEGNEGELCLAKSPGVDLGSFVAATQAFSKKLADATGGKSGQGDALLEMAKMGFPVRTKRKLSFNGRLLEVVSELESMKALDVPASAFEVPKDYQLQQMPTAPPPQARPRPAPSPKK